MCATWGIYRKTCQKDKKTFTNFSPALHHVNVWGIFRQFCYISPKNQIYTPPTLIFFVPPTDMGPRSSHSRPMPKSRPCSSLKNGSTGYATNDFDPCSDYYGIAYLTRAPKGSSCKTYELDILHVIFYNHV